MSLNINRNVDDPFYRYQMPPIQAKVEGKGNGIKTVIPNMVEIGKSLGRPPDYPTKFFGCELGAQTIMDHKNERYIVNGQFDAERFQDLLDVFIRKFVLCPGCDNPETVLRVTSKKAIEQTCKACGHRGFLDMTHRLTTYIINHPPNGSVEKKGNKLTKEERKALKKQKQQGASEEADETVDVDDDSVEWSVDTSEAAIQARQRGELVGAVAGLTMTDDLELPITERLERFHTYVESKVKETPFPANDVIAEAERLDCKEKGVMVLAEFLLSSNSPEDLLLCMKTHRKIFLRFVHENKKSQKYLLGALEKIISLNESVLLPKVSHFLKFGYDQDIFEEDVLISWGEKPSKKYVDKDLSVSIRQQSHAFIEWLKEADEESDDDDDDDDVTFDNTATKVGLVSNRSASPSAEEEDDDIDIDDI